MFNKYNSIENSYRDRSYNEAFEHPEAGNTRWNVTEKLDGTNFSFIVTTEGVRPGKRSGFIHENEKFFGFQDVFDPLKQSALDVFKNIQATNNNPEPAVQIFGEMVGSGILNRVDYKEKAFYAFDIMVDGEYLDFNDAVVLLDACGFNRVPTLFTGTAQEVQEYHDKFREKEFLFESTITLCDNHGLMINTNPETVKNVAEGIVIKPDKALYSTAGSRVILKGKAAKFNESKVVKQKKHVQMSEKDQAVLNLLEEYVTESRVYSVVSKLGDVSAKDFSVVLKLFTQDVKEEYERDVGNELHLDCDQVSGVIQGLNKLSATEIRKIWLNVIDSVNPVK